MTWDKTLPAGTNRLRDSDDYIRENQDCLDDAIDREHTFPGTKGSTAGQHTPGACGVLKVDTTANLGTGTGVAGAISYDTTTSLIMRDTGSALSSISGFPSGTKMFFYQNLAPAGWTIDDSVADKVLAVKGGSEAYNVDGGNTAGTWTQPDHTHENGSLAGPSHTHTGSSHTHTGPSHSHNVVLPKTGWNNVNDDLGGVLRGSVHAEAPMSIFQGRTLSGGASAAGTGATGAGGTGATGAGGTGAVTGTTAAGATAASFRIAAVIGIVCTKD